MKRLSNIAYPFIVLILLLYGAGGVALAKCSCSGKIKMLTFVDNSCCPTEDDDEECMQVTVLHLQDTDSQTQSHTVQPTVSFLTLSFPHHGLLAPIATRMRLSCHAVDSPPSGRLASTAQVLRV